MSPSSSRRIPARGWSGVVAEPDDLFSSTSEIKTAGYRSAPASDPPV